MTFVTTICKAKRYTLIAYPWLGQHSIKIKCQVITILVYSTQPRGYSTMPTRPDPSIRRVWSGRVQRVHVLCEEVVQVQVVLSVPYSRHHSCVVVGKLLCLPHPHTHTHVGRGHVLTELACLKSDLLKQSTFNPLVIQLIARSSQQGTCTQHAFLFQNQSLQCVVRCRSVALLIRCLQQARATLCN